MTREELEHIIRDSADVTDQYEFMIIGSQSILGSFPNPEAIFTMSAEADIYPLHAPELAEKIEAPSAKVRSFTRPMATTPKASGQKPPFCLPTG